MIFTLMGVVGTTSWMVLSEAFLGAAKCIAVHGTTALVPTTLTAETASLFQTFSVYNQAKNLNIDGAQFLGLHLEKPYFAISQRGAPDNVISVSLRKRNIEAILSHSQDIIRWSAAPELEDAFDSDVNEE